MATPVKTDAVPDDIRSKRAPADPDDQAWLGTCALLLLTGLTAGLISLLSDFNDTRWLHNGWTHITGLVLTVGLLMWGMSHLKGRMKQRMQAAVLVSLFMHLVFGFYIHRTSVEQIAARDGEDQPGEELIEETPVTLPDYTPSAFDEGAAPEPFEQPVETTTPDMPAEPLNRQTVDAPDSVARREMPAVDAAPEVEPARIELNRDESAAPHRGTESTTAELRRQSMPEPNLRQEAIPLPQVSTPSVAAAAAEPNVAPQRQLPGVSVDQQAALPPAAEGPSGPSSSPLPRQQSDTRPELSPGPVGTLERRPARLGDVAVTPAEAPQVAPSPQPTAGEPQPGMTAIARNGSAAPTAPRMNAEPSNDLPADIELPQVSPNVARRGGVSQSPFGVGVPAGAPSQIPRSIAGSDLSRVASSVEAVPGGGLAAGGEGGQVDASASASVSRGNASAPNAPVGGLAGSPPGIAGSVGPSAGSFAGGGIPGGTGRSDPSGFGQATTGRIARSNLGQPGVPSGMADEVGPVSAGASIDAPGVGSGAGTRSGRPGGIAGSGTGGSGGTGSGRLSPAGAVGAGVGPGQVGGAGTGTSVASALPEPGVASRRARPEGNILDPQTGRFVLPRNGSGPAIDGRIDERPAAAFNQRNPQQREDIATSRGGSASSERSVELGLDFLVRHQSSGGNWSLHAFGFGRPGYANAGLGRMQADTAATGLALLSFLGAGYTHLDGKHRDVVRRGLDYLVRNQKADGDLFTTGSRYVWLYSHGIASIALCEAYGMTRDPQLREPAQRAIDFIVAAQSPTEGGWRYAPRQGTDTSVSGWQLMALKSGELAGLQVPPSCYLGVQRWLSVAQGQSNGALYAYRPASEQPHQRDPSAAMTAEGLLMRLYLHGDRSEPSIVEGAEYLRVRLPQFGTEARPQRDTYYWYYATQALFQVQGDAWTAWNNELRNLLVASQVQTGPLAGSWDPLRPVPDRWGMDGGRIYVTAMHLLNLEVYYRHLPLYRSIEGVANRP